MGALRPGRRVLAAAVLFLTACTARGADSTDSTAPASTVAVPTGTTDELLARLVVEVGRISEAIIGDGDQTAILAEAEALWFAARDGVDDTVAAESMQEMMDLARVAVERKRPADADKAAKFLGDLVDQYVAT